VYQFAGVNAPNQPQLDQPRASATSPATALGPPNPDRILQNAGAWLDADAHALSVRSTTPSAITGR
jgi:hypothetical protein